jgi:hypothetical protein
VRAHGKVIDLCQRDLRIDSYDAKQSWKIKDAGSASAANTRAALQPRSVTPSTRLSSSGCLNRYGFKYIIHA